MGGELHMEFENPFLVFAPLEPLKSNKKEERDMTKSEGEACLLR